MTVLRNKGLTFALDDFGTGYSSLSILKRLPIDRLKIDRSFVQEIPVDQNANTIVRAIVGLGNSLGLMMVAEGVETAQQLDFLNQNGCHAYQGYLFARPLNNNDLQNYANQAR
jgi:EAL domain-containing protein (putative c-di-GMP-specific phosphodiesterase class I)